MPESIDDLSQRVDILAEINERLSRRLDATDRHILNIEDLVTRLGERIDDLRTADDARPYPPSMETPLHDMLSTGLGPVTSVMPAVDPQSEVFRGSTESDWTTDDDIAAMRGDR